MTTLAQLKVVLSGSGVVGGGVSTFYCLPADVDALADALDDFYDVVAASSPDNVTFTIQRSGFTINDADGEAVGTWSGTGTPHTVAGASTASFLMGAGIRVKWITAGVRNDRHVTGSTFLVPFGSGAFTTDGRLATANQVALQAAADTLVGAAVMRILSRPSVAEPTGENNVVTAAQVPLEVSWLRSRRT